MTKTVDDPFLFGWDLGVLHERARIIKLLEVTDWLHVCDCGCSPEDTCSARDGIIALIKGESK